MRNFGMRLGGGAALALAVGVVAAGCSESDSGRALGNAAIELVLPDLEESMLSGAANLIASVSSGTVANPLAAEVDSTQTITLPIAGDNGSTDEVVVDVDVQTASDGSGTIEIEVQESGTTHVFLNAVLTSGAPRLSYRAPPLAYSALDLQSGEGTAFIIARVVTDGTITRTLLNTSVDTHETLVDPMAITGLSDGTLTGAFTRYQDLLLKFAVALDGGGLKAEVEDVRRLSRGMVFERSGGPAVSQLVQDFKSFVVGGSPFDANQDVSLPIGGDLDPAGFDPDADITLTVEDIAGGLVPASGIETDVRGALVTTLTGSTQTTFTHSTQLAAAGAEVDDDAVDIGQTVEVVSETWENTASIAHTLDTELSVLENVAQALYLPCFTDTARVVPLYR